jgi:hypothetical protein
LAFRHTIGLRANHHERGPNTHPLHYRELHCLRFSVAAQGGYRARHTRHTDCHDLRGACLPLAVEGRIIATGSVHWRTVCCCPRAPGATNSLTTHKGTRETPSHCGLGKGNRRNVQPAHSRARPHPSTFTGRRKRGRKHSGSNEEKESFQGREAELTGLGTNLCQR